MKTTGRRRNHRGAMPARASLAVAMILGWAAAAQAQDVKGTGTANTITVWTGKTTVGNSLMKQSGGNINVTGGLTTTGPISGPSLSGNGSGVTNVNAATLGGLLPSGFARLALPNTFTADQAINGNLSLTGSINSTLTLQGNLTDASGNMGANVVGGFGGNTTVPGNSVSSGVVGATIAGGGGFFFNGSPANVPNSVTGPWGTVGGGMENVAGPQATVAGGFVNTASGDGATVGGGGGNTAKSGSATVGGGANNTASNFQATVGGGSANTASGVNSTVPGGAGNIAAGTLSFAAGFSADAKYDGSFVWGDGSGHNVVNDTGPDQFVALASGGFTFYTAPDFSTGATLPTGSGSWSMLSDKAAKANFSAVDGQSLLARLATLPISSWNYKAQPDSVRHMGPTAQDFRAAFGLGEDERHISTVDAQGVALAAIQALYETVTELKKDLGDKDNQIVELRARLAHLEQHQ